MKRDNEKKLITSVSYFRFGVWTNKSGDESKGILQQLRKGSVTSIQNSCFR